MSHYKKFVPAKMFTGELHTCAEHSRSMTCKKQIHINR